MEKVGDTRAVGEFERTADGGELIAEDAEGEESDAHALFIICEGPRDWTDETAFSNPMVERNGGKTKRVVLRDFPHPNPRDVGHP
jgi:hypothetical protein